MANALVDTSAWIAALRGSDPLVKKSVDELLRSDRLVLCGIVEMELLHGMRPTERSQVLPLFEALPYVEVDREDWRAAGRLLGELRSKGHTIPSSDALIAALCLRHDLFILTTDRHFDRIPKLKHLKISGCRSKA